MTLLSSVTSFGQLWSSRCILMCLMTCTRHNIDIIEDDDVDVDIAVVAHVEINIKIDERFNLVVKV